MAKEYDNFLNIKGTTEILDEKDGYYSLKNTLFYGEKGGMLGDKGTLNGLEVIDLKWIDGVLYHKVDGKLVNPVEMDVDLETRLINTSVQSAFHLLDGYYRRKGNVIVAIGVSPELEWFEVDSKDITDEDLEDIQKYLNDAIIADIPLELKYIAGKDYEDDSYREFDEVRVVKFGELDIQPCATLHVNRTSQIESFVVLDKEKTSRGTRIYTTVNRATNLKLKEYYSDIKKISQLFKIKKEEVVSYTEQIAKQLNETKKALDELNDKLSRYQAKEISENEDRIIILSEEEIKNIKAIVKALNTEYKSEKFLIDSNTVNIISASGKARELFDRMKEKTPLKGGGSPTAVTVRYDMPTEEIVKLINDVI